MCGICGYIGRKNITLEQLKEMNDTMYHRGPDDSGEEIYEMGGGWLVGFAQRRLSILDLSALGHQPMHSPDRRVSIVYNGEIYNFRELREELADYSFRSDCDTEVIIAAYLKWGIQCVERFNGMFAIALYDRQTQEIFLVRDRIGKKPLYYWYENDELAFASELKPIMKCPGFTGEIESRVLSRYLFHQYINAPESIWKRVFKVEPGAILRFVHGKISTWKYWDIKEIYRQAQSDRIEEFHDAKEELKRLLKKSVRMRMIADVPLGSFLSGGYDSSLITAIAQECSDSPVKTFSIGFHEEKYNEAKYARAVAESGGEYSAVL